jgi:hypothetical protein
MVEIEKKLKDRYLKLTLVKIWIPFYKGEEMAGPFY